MVMMGETKITSIDTKLIATTGSSGQIYVCNCSRKFSTVQGLLSHFDIQKASVKCDTCGHSFKNNCAFNYHKLLENDIKRDSEKQQKQQQQDSNKKITYAIPIVNPNSIQLNKQPLNVVKVISKNNDCKRLKIIDLQPQLSADKINIQSTKVVNTKTSSDEKLASILSDLNSTETVCPVCTKTFNETIDLKLHARSHGIAFLKYCQQRQKLNNVK